MLIDSHCHLASHRFNSEEIESIVSNAVQHDVKKMITLSTSLEDCPQNLELAERFPEVYATVGIHPCDVHLTKDDFIDELTAFAQHQKCVAIGETGLDYFHPAPEGWSDDDYHARQRDFLEQHFALAAKLKKNIVIHTRDKSGLASLDDSLAIYRKWADQVTAVFHCFLGPIENAKDIFELGGVISFTGISTFKSAKDCASAAIAAPKGKFMVETDSPYLAPAPHRGKRCEPAYTALTAQHIAKARNETIEEFSLHTSETAHKFYKI